MQQIRTTNKVLHRSASNYILNDLQSTGEMQRNCQPAHHHTSPAQIAMTKQTFNKNLENVINDRTQ